MFAVEALPTSCAETLYVPATQFGVQLTVAMPALSLIAKEFESVHDAPLSGARKSTRTPSAARPNASRTFARIDGPLAEPVTVAFGGGSTAPYRMARTRMLSPSMKKRLPS